MLVINVIGDSYYLVFLGLGGSLEERREIKCCIAIPVSMALRLVEFLIFGLSFHQVGNCKGT